MAKMSGIDFEEIKVPTDTPDSRAELLLLSPSILVPCLQHNKIKVWDTLAIGEYLNEIAPKQNLLPSNTVHRAHCRAICGEMHSGFSALRSSLPMNIKARIPMAQVWSKAKMDMERIFEIWEHCLHTYKGPYLFGKSPCMADAMYAPVVTRFLTYGIALDPLFEAYSKQILSLPPMKEWIADAQLEPDDIEELEVEF